jgi:hypothetical protein
VLAATSVFGAREQYFAHFGRGGGAVTEFTVYNPGSKSVDVTLEVFRSSGTRLATRVVTVGPGATRTASFVGGESAEAGWVRLFADGDFSATEFFQTPIGNVGVLPGFPANRQRIFAFLGETTSTGFALANPNDEEADFRLQWFSSSGNPLGSVDLQLPARGHMALFLDQEPISMQQNGTVEIVSDRPLLALTLRLDERLLASVGLVSPGLPIWAVFNNSTPSILAGASENWVAADVVGATISGGGLDPDALTPPERNRVTDNWGTVGGGSDNQAGNGAGTTLDAHWATVGGGRLNSASAVYATVAGGVFNRADTSWGATVGGGDGNQASGVASTIPGGRSNLAQGNYSFAAGLRSKANHDGAFVWSDSSDQDFGSTNSDQFLMRASGGVGINTNSPQGALDVNGAIYQRGTSLHADYVFDPDYRLESIEEHSRLMWSKKHLPALGPGRQNEQGQDVVEYGARMRGLLEELEKAHVYIEQLNRRLLKQEEAIARLTAALQR